MAQLFVDSVYKLHGMPSSIVSVQDKTFTSKLWQELFRLSDTALKMSSSYHPRADGQRNELTNALKHFFGALCMLALQNGHHGFPWLNFGTTRVSIHHWADLLLKSCVVVHLDSWSNND
jgi:hypothetical protein